MNVGLFLQKPTLTVPEISAPVAFRMPGGVVPATFAELINQGKNGNMTCKTGVGWTSGTVSVGAEQEKTDALTCCVAPDRRGSDEVSAAVGE